MGFVVLSLMKEHHLPCQDSRAGVKSFSFVSQSTLTSFFGPMPSSLRVVCEIADNDLFLVEVTHLDRDVKEELHHASLLSRTIV